MNFFKKKKKTGCSIPTHVIIDYYYFYDDLIQITISQIFKG